MIDIFSEDYQLRRLRERMARSLEEAKKRTPEEKIKYLHSFGICDENGNLNPGYEFLRYADPNF